MWRRFSCSGYLLIYLAISNCVGVTEKRIAIWNMNDHSVFLEIYVSLISSTTLYVKARSYNHDNKDKSSMIFLLNSLCRLNEN